MTFQSEAIGRLNTNKSPVDATRRRLKLATVATVLIGCFPLASCDQDVGAVATCGSILSAQSRLGIVNTPHFAIGSIFVVNTATKQGTFVTALAVDPSQLVLSPQELSYKSHLEQSLDVALSVSLPSGAEAALKSYISAMTLLDATNVIRKSVIDVAGLINGNQEAMKAINSISPPASNSLNYIMVVSTVTYVDALNIELDNASKVTANVSAMKIGNYNLSVTYKCENALTVSGPGAGAFFKVTTLKFVPEEHRVFIDASADINLSDYNLIPAVAIK